MVPLCRATFGNELFPCGQRQITHHHKLQKAKIYRDRWILKKIETQISFFISEIHMILAKHEHRL
jgi:hypothetical protein